MKKYNKKWAEICSKEILSESFIEKHKNLVNWYHISLHQKLSEKFIEKYKHEVVWEWISHNQKLSESFIEKHKDLVNRYHISCDQQLSESFIEKHKDLVDWNCISRHQKLSEKFIEKHKDLIHWYNISIYQKLSKKFIEKYKDKININLYNKFHKTRTKREKLKEMKLYAKKYNLKFDGKFLYAYRNHDKWGRGYYNGAIFYETGKYYRDWHCDMNPEEEYSFGLWILSKGNTPVKVSVDDWGTVVNNSEKCRVWGFIVLDR